MSHNIHCITPITRHSHANNLPSTEQATKIQPKQDKFFVLSFFIVLTVYLLFKCRFVAWQRGFPRKIAYCVSVSKEISVRLNLFVFGSCFRTLAVFFFFLSFCFVFCFGFDFNQIFIFWQWRRRYVHNIIPEASVTSNKPYRQMKQVAWTTIIWKTNRLIWTK